MRNHTEILRGASADFRLADTGPESGFIGFGRRLQIVFLMRFHALVERFLGCGHRFFGSGDGKAEREQHARREFPVRGSLPDHETEQKQHERCGKRIAEAVDRFCGFYGLVLMRRECADAFFERANSGISGGGTDVDSARAFREFAELFFVQRTVHDISVRIGQGFDSAASVRDLDDGGLGRIADSGDEQRNLARDNFVDGFSAVAFEFIAVGDEDDGAVAGLRRLERLERRGERLLDIGSPERNGIGREFVEREFKTGAVGCQRTLQEAFPRKSDEPEPVVRVELDEFLHQPFRVSETRGLNILCEHAPGDVEDEEQVASLSVEFLYLHAPGRSCRGGDETEDGEAEEDEAENAPAFREQNVVRVFRVFPEERLQSPCGFV